MLGSFCSFIHEVFVPLEQGKVTHCDGKGAAIKHRWSTISFLTSLPLLLMYSQTIGLEAFKKQYCPTS